MKSWKRMGGGVLFAALLTTSGQAGAVVDKAVYLLLDGTGSIDNTEFNQQVSAYVMAITNVLNPGTGIAIGAALFGGDDGMGGTQNEFFALREIAVAGDKQDLIDAFNGLDPNSRGVDTGSTAIGNAVTFASEQLLTAFNECLSIECIIDVSTDGQNNSGSDPETAVSNAVTIDGIDAVNCIAVGNNADCDFVDGFGFQIAVSDFDAFQRGIEDKIGREVGVPEPGSVLLLAVGLVALGLAASRRRGMKRAAGRNGQALLAA